MPRSPKLDLSPTPTRRACGATEQATCATIEEWAELQFGPDDIAFQIGVTVESLKRKIADAADPFAQAYRRGRLRAEAVVAKSLYTLAQQGSSPAQRQFLDRIADRQETGEQLESLVASEKRKETALADMREMEAAKVRGELLDAATVAKESFASARSIRNRILAVPDVAANEVQGQGPIEAAATIRRLLVEALNELAGEPAPE